MNSSDNVAQLVPESSSAVPSSRSSGSGTTGSTRPTRSRDIMDDHCACTGNEYAFLLSRPRLTYYIEENGMKCTDPSICTKIAMKMECQEECGPKCQNQFISREQFLRSDSLVVADAGAKGQGLFADKDILQNTMVIEYVGRRMSSSPESNTEYVLKFSEGFIDGNQGGNDSRFINHSCNPNLEAEEWLVGSMPRMVLKAIRDIPAGNELTFFYNRHDGTTCRCGTTNCLGRFSKRKGAENKALVAPTNHQLSAKDLLGLEGYHSPKGILAANFSRPGKIRCAHLLVEHRDSRYPASWRKPRITRSVDGARELIKRYQGRIKGGESLPNLAATESDCNSARKGGDL